MHAPKPKRARKKKDPDAPKRPRSAYIFFCTEKRVEVKEDNPELKGTEVTKKLGQLWKGEYAKESKRVKWVKKATEDKIRYKTEMKTYEPSDSDSGTTKRSRKSKKGGPKRALTAYIYFCKDMRSKIAAKNEDMKATDVSKKLGELWKTKYAKDKKRAKWIALAAEDKERYLREKEEWANRGDTVVNVPQKKRKSKAKVVQSDSESEPEQPVTTVQSDSESEPEQPVTTVQSDSESEPEQEEVKTSRKSSKRKSSKRKSSFGIARSGMLLFCKEERSALEKEYPSWSTRKVVAELKRRWADLEDEERESYKTRTE
jgi:hypothetical protein